LAKRKYVNEAKRIIRRISSCIRELEEESRDLIRNISIEDETLRNQALAEVESKIVE